MKNILECVKTLREEGNFIKKINEIIFGQSEKRGPITPKEKNSRCPQSSHCQSAGLLNTYFDGEMVITVNERDRLEDDDYNELFELEPSLFSCDGKVYYADIKCSEKCGAVGFGPNPECAICDALSGYRRLASKQGENNK